MDVDEDAGTVPDPLEGDIVVAGPGAALGTVREWVETDDQVRVATWDGGDVREVAGDAGVVVLVVEESAGDTESIVRLARSADGFVLAVFGRPGERSVEPSVLESVREVVDVTLLATPRRTVTDTPSKPDADGPTEPPTGRPRADLAVGGALDFLRMVRQPGHVNVDLADARTVLTDGSLAVLVGGTALLDAEGAETAVRRAFESLPQSIDTARESGALVSIVGDPTTSLDDAIAAVRAVREQVGAVDDVIWGVATDDTLSDRVTVDVLVDDVTDRPPLSPGDPCRRCGAALSAYAYEERTAVACESCGFADLSVSLTD